MYQFAALFQGKCSGHGAGAGGKWQPGPGGGPVAPCAPGNLDTITHLPMTSGHSVMAHWKGAPQLPFDKPLVTNIVINGKIPIVNTDLLALHPTESVYIVARTAGKCYQESPANAWHCHTYTGVGNNPTRGCETAAGHIRKCFATTKSVFIGGQLAGRMGDPLGDGTTAFPCESVIVGASKDVIIGV